MYTHTSRRLVGWHVVLVSFVLLFGIVAAGIAWTSNRTAAATPCPKDSKNNSCGTWYQAADYQCTGPGQSNHANAVISYTDSLNHTTTFKCYRIDTYPGNIKQMVLDATTTDKCNTSTNAQAIRVAAPSSSTVPPTGNYNDAKVGHWSGWQPQGQSCTSNDFDFTLLNTYDAAIPDPTADKGGTAQWSAKDPGSAQIKANFWGGTYTKDDKGNGHQETFDEVAPGVTNNVMPLVGTSKPVTEIDCPADRMEVAGDPSGKPSYMDVTTATIITQIAVDQSAQTGGGKGCQEVKIPVTLDQSYRSYGGTDETSGSSSSGTQNDECPTGASSHGFGWFLCPIFFLARDTVDGLNKLIQNLLYVNTDLIFGGKTNYKQPYDNFRNIALSLLIISGLIMVISEAAGLDMFSAHTIRKALPRIVIAAIGLSLAWPLMQAAITFFNDLGSWIGTIIMSAASIPGTSYVGVNNPTDIGANLIQYALFGAAGAIALIFVGFGFTGAISLLFTIILGLLIGAAVLVFRQVAIIMCIMLAPLAIAASVLPGTEKLWKLWKDTLLGALLMFPIVMAFLASGAAVASVSTAQAEAAAKSSNGQGQFSFVLIALIAYFLPYFLLPLAFKMTSGLVSNIFGMVNDRSKGIFDGLRKQRQNERAKNREALRHGSRFNPDSRATRWLGGRAFNRIGAHYGAGLRGGFGFGARGAVARANMAVASADQVAKEDQMFAQMMNNEDAMVAIAFGNDRRALSQLRYFQREEVDPATGRMRRVVDNAKLNSALAAGRNVHATRRTQTAAVDALARSGKVIENRAEFDSMMQHAAGGNRAMQDALTGNTRYTYRQVGRADLGRGNDYEALQEMDIAAVGKQKWQSLENLFGIAPGGGTPGILNAMHTSTSPDEQQHFADVLFAAQYNASLSPQQQQYIQEAIDQVNRDGTLGRLGLDVMRRAGDNYRSKLQPPSDRRLKKHIKPFYKLDSGIQLYSFTYIWGGPTYVGVMAQDLLDTFPEALVSDKLGYYHVDYAKLGLQMIELKDWAGPTSVSLMTNAPIAQK